MTFEMDGEYISTRLVMFIVVIGRTTCLMERDHTFSVQEKDFKGNYKKVVRMDMVYITTSMVILIQDNG
jgi:hypothetical protein